MELLFLFRSVDEKRNKLRNKVIITNRKFFYLILIYFASSYFSYFEGCCMAVEEGKIVIVIRTTELRVQPVFRGQYGFASGFIRCLCSEVYWIVGIPRSIPLFSSIQRERKEKKQAITGKNCAISDYGHVSYTN